jgi:hypothetical protein
VPRGIQAFGLKTTGREVAFDGRWLFDLKPVCR